MGSIDSKSISNQIDKSFKSIRKYQDNFYGQITLVQNKYTNKKYALVQKIILTLNKQINEYLRIRTQNNSYLVTLFQYYHCSVDYCSGLEKYFFLLQYSSHTLYNQMVRRQQIGLKFNEQQILDIFSNMLEIISFFKQKQTFKYLISNHNLLYFSPKQLKTLQSLMKVQNDTFQFDFHLIQVEEGVKQLYLSPQAYYLLCNRQRFEAKNKSLTQQSIVFMLGMNLIQCALLADILQIYTPQRKCIDFNKLNIILKQVQNLYGEQIREIISQMVSKNSNQRPKIQQVKQFISLNLKKRKIMIPKTIRSQKLQIKPFNKQKVLTHRIR